MEKIITLIDSKSLNIVSQLIQGIGFYSLNNKPYNEKEVQKAQAFMVHYLLNTTPRKSDFIEYFKRTKFYDIFTSLDTYDVNNTFTQKILLAQVLVNYAFNKYIRSYSKWSVHLPQKYHEQLYDIMFYPILFNQNKTLMTA